MSESGQEAQKVIVDDVVYDLGTVPKPDSKIVSDKKADILVGVRLDKLVSNLNITTELVHLAYNATPEKYGTIRGNINKLHVNFADLCGECSSELSYVREAADVISSKVADAYSRLYAQQEAAAVAILSTCSGQAEELSDRMGALAEKFDNLSAIADQALLDSEVARGQEISDLEDIMKKKNDFEADQANLKTLQESLNKLLEELDSEYREAKDDLNTTEERAFTLSIVGAVMGPIGQGLGAAGSALAGYYATQDPSRIVSALKSGGNDGGGGSDGENNVKSRATPEQLKKVDKAKEDLDAAKVDFEAAEADIDALDAAIAASEALKESVEESDASAEDKAERKKVLDGYASDAKSKKDDASISKEEAERLREEHQKKWEAAKTVVESLGVAASEVGSNLQAMGDDYFALAGQQRKRVRELFEVMLQKQDAERDALAKIEEITVRLSGLDTQRQTAEITISALFQTIGALKQIVNILHEASLFWNNMKKACKALADSGIITEISSYTGDDFAAMDRVELFYSSDGFKKRLLNNLAKWVALGEIARIYVEETTTIREESRENFQKNLNSDEAAVVVSDLSVKLLGDLSTQLEGIESESDVIRQALKNISAAETV